MVRPKGEALLLKTPTDPDGTQWVLAEVEGVGQCEIAFREEAAIDIVVQMQASFLERRFEMIRPPSYPQAIVDRLHLGHAPDGRTALMIATEEFGTIAYVLPPGMLTNLREEVVRLEQQLAGKAKPKN